MAIVCIPGFSQPASTWDPVIAALPDPVRADTRAVEVPDALDFAATAAAIGADGGRATYVGYSMGGRLALQLAIDRPDLVTHLVLVSAGLGIADTDERADRVVHDRRQAERVHELGVTAFLDEWVRQPLFATLPPDAAMLDERADAMSADRLAHQLIGLGQGTMAPLHDRLGSVRAPTTVVVGARDPRYTAIGELIVDGIRVANLVSLRGGHALPLECPAALAAVIADVHDATA